MAKDLTKVEIRLNEVNELINRLYIEREELHARLTKQERNRSLLNPITNKRHKRKDITLVKVFYTHKGLGYEEDYDDFSEYSMFFPDSDDISVRFLSKQSIEKYSIPYTYTKYDRMVHKQNSQFEKLFGKVIEVNMNNFKDRFFNL